MNVKPVASPQAVQQAPSNAAAARAKAVAAFNQGAQPPAQVVQNQNQISPEELGAIKAPEESGQEDIVEESQEVSAEATPAEPKQETPQETALSRQFAQLARQEKQLRHKAQQQEQAIKAREAAITAREAELAKAPAFDPKQYYTRDQVKQNALDVLAEAGVSYDDLTQQIVSQQPTDPRVMRTISSLEQTVKSLEAKLEAQAKSQEANQTTAYQAAVQQIRSDVTNMVKTDTAYEMIKATNSIKDVVELIEETYKKDGILLSNEDAAQQVEDYLVEEGLKLARLSKVQQKLSKVAPKTATSPAQTSAASPKQPQPMKTLTNATASSRQLSAKERAILAFKGELKS